MKRLLQILLVICLNSSWAQSTLDPGTLASNVFNGYKVIKLDNERVFYVYFNDENGVDKTLNYVTVPGTASGKEDIDLNVLFHRGYTDIHAFSENITVDGQNASNATGGVVGDGNIRYSAGHYEYRPVLGLNTSEKPYAGKISLSWNRYSTTDQGNTKGKQANGYLIFRDIPLDGSNMPLSDTLEVYQVINNPLTTSWDDTGISLNGAIYYVLAFNVSDEEKKFVSGAASIKAETKDMEFTAYRGSNEDIVTVAWSYDNSVLDNKLNAVQEIVKGEYTGEQFNQRLYLSDYNIGNSRLQFTTIGLQENGVTAALPQISAGNRSTLEFWFNVGPLNFETLVVSNQTSHSYLSVQREQLRYNGETFDLKTKLMSNSWNHFALSNDGVETSVFINGFFVGKVLNRFGELNPFHFGRSSSAPGLSVNGTRLGIVRIWESARTQGQIYQDQYDFYQAKDLPILNLRNQWSIAQQGIELVSGLVNASEKLAITNNGNKNPSFEQAYIFDRSDITRILQVKTTELNDKFFYENFEFGTVNLLLDDISAQQNNFTYPAVDNTFNLLYDPTDLSTINFEYVTGSTLPYDYVLTRTDSLGNEVVLEDNIAPYRIVHAGKYGGSDVSVPTTLSTDDRAYRFLYRLPFQEIDHPETLINLGDVQVVANKQSQLELHYGSVHEEEGNPISPYFISTLKDNSWESLTLSFSKPASDIIYMVPFINGQRLDTIKLNNSLTLNGAIQFPGTGARNLELGYFATLDQPANDSVVKTLHRLIPDIGKGWELYHHVDSSDVLIHRWMDESAPGLSSLQYSKIEKPGISTIDETISDLSFLNYGNVLTTFNRSDIHSNSNPFQAGDTLVYTFKPRYLNTYDTASIYNLKRGIRLPEFNLSLAYDDIAREVTLTWDTALLKQHGYDSINIYRNLECIAHTCNANSYVDKSFAHGKFYTYDIRLIKNGVEHIRESDTLSISPNGTFSGYLLSTNEDIIVPNAAIELASGNQTINVNSDQHGVFFNSGITYGLKETFVAPRAENGSISLTKSKPASTNNFLFTERNYSLTRVSNLMDVSGLVPYDSADHKIFRMPLTAEGRATLSQRDYYLNIYLNGEIIALVENDTVYKDVLARQPINDYTFQLYYFESANQVVVDRYTLEDVANTNIARVSGLAVVDSVEVGMPLLKWNFNPSIKVDGFSVIRSSSPDGRYTEIGKAKTLEGENQYQYLDRKGVPGVAYYYGIVPFFAVDSVGLIGSSSDTLDHAHTYPPVDLSAFTVTLDVATHELTVHAVELLNKAVDGFTLLNNGEVINLIAKEDYYAESAAAYTYDLNLGLYTGEAFNPALKIYKHIDDPDFSNYSINYTGLAVNGGSSAALNVNTSIDQVTSEAMHYVKIELVGAGSVVPESYSLYVDDGNNGSDELIKTVPGHAKTIAYIPNVFDEEGNRYDYKKDITVIASNGETVFNERYNFSKTNVTNALGEPAHFEATVNAVGEILLKWDYPTYGQALFDIYRDGTLIEENLPTSFRSFVDKDPALENGVDYVYQLQGKYIGRTTKFFNAIGRKASNVILNGVVFDPSGTPIPYANILVTYDNKQVPFKADSLGVYHIDQIDFNYGTTIDLTCAVPRTSGESPTTITHQVQVNGEGMYSTNFRFDNLYHFYESENELAVIVKADAYYNNVKNQINLRWATSSDSVSRFDIYDAKIGGKISEIPAGGLNEITLENVEPDADFEYVIIPVLVDTNGEDIMSSNEPIAVSIETPPVLPIIADFFIPEILIEDGVIKMEWGRASSNDIDGYRIERKGSTIATVETSDFVDNMGIPDHSYSYKVIPFKLVSGKVFEASEITISPDVKFPSIAEIPGFTASPDMEHFSVKLDWTYPEIEGIIEGVEIKREEDIIARVAYPDSTFTDELGHPNTRTSYSIELLAKLTEDVTDVFRSKPAYDTAWYPTLQAITSDLITLDNTSKSDTLVVNWTYASPVTRFEFSYKSSDSPNDSTITGVPLNEDGTYQYFISGYLPETDIEMTLRAIKSIDDELYSSNLYSFSDQLPAFPGVSSSVVQVLNDVFYYQWDFDKNTFNYDYSALEVENVHEGFVDKEKRAVYFPVDGNYAPKPTFRIRHKRQTGFSPDNLDPVLASSSAKNNRDDYNNWSSRYRGFVSLNEEADEIRVTLNITDDVFSSGDYFECYRIFYNPTTGTDSVSFVEKVSYIHGHVVYDTYISDDRNEPGHTYIYVAKAFRQDGSPHLTLEPFYDFRSDVIAVESKAKATATAVSENGNIPVAGIPFKLEAKVLDGYVYRYDSTDENGAVLFENLPIKDKDGTKIVYSLRPNLPQDEYTWSFQGTFGLNHATEHKFITPLKYRNVFEVVGRVKHDACGACGIDSVSVKLDAYDNESYNGNPVFTTQELTDENGNYTLTAPPIKRYFYRITIDEEAPDGLEEDRQKYLFASRTREFTGIDFDGNGRYEQTFNEKSLLPLKLKVSDGCDASLGDYRFRIRISDLENQYDSVFLTNEVGELAVEVPPYNYRVQLVGVNDPDAFAATVVDYFRSRFEYVLYEAQLQAAFEDEEIENPLEFVYVINLDKKRLKFLQTPSIVVDSGLDPASGVQGSGCSNRDILVLDARNNTRHNITFKILDGDCELQGNEYHLRIKNHGAFGGEIDQVVMDLSGSSPEDGVWEYSFTPANPNMTAPFKHLIEVYYQDRSGNIITSEVYEYIILGDQLVNGNDVFVDPVNDEGESYADMPIYVLRDPPGDHSYAYIEAGTEFALSLETSKSNSLTTGGGVKSSADMIIASATNSNWSQTVGVSATNVSTIKFKVKERISTAQKTELSTNLKGYLDGRDADVIVGTGFVYQYGIMDSLYLDNSCEVSKAEKYTIEPTGVRTTWYFTRSMINQTIAYYESLIGSNTSPGGTYNQVVEYDIAKQGGSITNVNAFLTQAVANWNNVLDLTDGTLHPFCALHEVYKSFVDVDPGKTDEQERDEFANEIKHRLETVFDEQDNEVINFIHANTKKLIDSLIAYKSVYDGLIARDANICGSSDPVDPFKYLFDGLSDDDIETFSKAFSAARKLQMLADYVLFQLAEVEASSRITETLYNTLDNPQDFEYILRAAATNRITEEYSRSVLYNGYISAVTNLELLNEEFEKATDEYNQIQQEFDQLAGDAGITQEEIDAKQAELDDAGINVDRSAARAAEGLSLARDVIGIGGNTIAFGRTTIYSAKLAYKFSRIGAGTFNGFKVGIQLAAGGAKVFSVTGIGLLTALGSIIGDAIVHDQFKTTSDVLYEKIRDNYYVDLARFGALTAPETDLGQYLGYDGVENVTFGANTKIERTYQESDMVSNSQLANYGTAYRSTVDVGFNIEFDFAVGFLFETKVKGPKFKLLASLSTDEKVGQKINSTQTDIRTTQVGYVFEDNDDGDQFSTYIINTLSPFNNTVSPYFHVVGGRSSDPYEEGTISRDYPTISPEDDQGNLYPSVYFNQDPNVPVIIPIKITSGNRFNEGRSIAVTLKPNSNQNSAVVLVNNAELYVNRETTFFIDSSDDAVYTNLIIDPLANIYEYPDVDLVVRPHKVKSDFFADDPDVFDTLHVEVYFRKPVSPVHLATHDGSWFINKAKAPEETKDNYVFYIDGYDVEGKKSNLKYIELQYKRAGSDQFEWRPISRIMDTDPLSGEVFDPPVIRDTIGIQELKLFYQKNNRIYQEPTFPFEWDITGNTDLVDGEYLVRAVSFDENGLFEFSNVYAGKIDRKGPRLVENPSPKDSIFSLGDAISVTFDEVIDKGYFSAEGFAKIKIYNLVNKDSVIAEFPAGAANQMGFEVMASDNNISAEIGLLPMYYDGHVAEISVAGIYDLVGNAVTDHPDTLSWSFKLDYFKQDPSIITLLEPQNWRYNYENDADSLSRDTLSFLITDYDLFETSSALQSVALQVNRQGSNEWKTVASKTRLDLLQEFGHASDADMSPQSYISWVLSLDQPPVSDGIYDVRALAFNYEGQYNISNIRSGRIDRVKPSLVSLPSPADGILSKGEQVFFRYDEDIDHQLNTIKVEVFHQGSSLAEDLYSVVASGNGIEVIFTDEWIQGVPPLDSVEVSVAHVYDLAGNMADEARVKFVTDHHAVPVSNISIVGMENWLVNTNTGTSLPIIINNYSLFDTDVRLDSISLEYRAFQNIGDDKEVWSRIPLEDKNGDEVTLTKEVLVDRFINVNGLQAEDFPVDTLYWYTHLLPDHQYEVRAVAYAGRNFNVSGYKKGRVDKTYPTIFGPSEPVDKLLSRYDRAGLNFSEAINYSILGSDVLDQNTMVYSYSDTLGYSDYDISVSGSGIEMGISPTYIAGHIGDTLFVKIDGVEDLYGNPLYEDIDWSFRLQQQQLKPAPSSILSPYNYIVNLENESEDVKFVISDFDPDESYSSLDVIYLEYKRSTENEWSIADQLDKATLRANYKSLEANSANSDDGFLVPVDTLVFGITDTAVPDGDYHFRVATLGNNAYAYTSVVDVLIDRSSPVVHGFSPSDQVFSRGDVISISFNESIDIANPISYEVDGLDGQGYFEMIRSSSGVTFQPTGKFESEMADLDGSILIFSIDGVKDLAGNVSEEIRWSFVTDFLRIPPGPVNIKSPSQITVTKAVETQQVPIVMDGFELNNTNTPLDWIELEVQVGGSTHWETFHVLTRDELESQNERVGGVLEAEYTWTITHEITEGNHQIRAKSSGNEQTAYSNTVDVTVDRLAPELMRFEPVDGIYSPGDKIRFDFNEALLSTRLAAVSVSDPDGNPITEDFAVSQSASSIVLQPKSDLIDFDGEELRIVINGVFDEVGNELAGGVAQGFVVDYFSKPASPVNLVVDDNFILNLSSEVIEVEVTGYDVFEIDHDLDSIVLEYRLLLGDEPWVLIASHDIDHLRSLDTAFPVTVFEWHTTGLVSGDYALRATSYGKERYQYSNVVQGIVDRERPRVSGLPSPDDQLLDLTDPIAVSFTEEISPVGIEAKLRALSTNEIVPTASVIGSSSISLLFTPEDRFAHAGDSLRLEVSGVKDLASNAMENDFSWDFMVNRGGVELSGLHMSNDGWVVNSATRDKPVAVAYSGFDVITREVDSLVFEYRREEDGTWKHLATRSRQDLLDPGSQVSDTILWSTQQVVDGEYQIRGLVYGFGGQGTVKAGISGVIDRTPPGLLSVYPSDSSYVFGDAISFNFDESISCVSGYAYEVQLIDGDQVSRFDGLSPICDAGGSLIFGPNDEVLHPKKGKTVKITVSELYDTYGNGIDAPVELSFVVDDFLLETSPVSLVSPSDNFLINESGYRLPITIGGYDLSQSFYALDSIEVQFSEAFTNEWKVFWRGTSEFLREHYLSTGQAYFDLSWDLGEEIADGFYSIRAVAFGNGGISRASGSVPGEIDRTGPDVREIHTNDSGVIIGLTEELSDDLSSATIVMKQMVNGVSTSKAGRVSQTQAALSHFATISPAYYEIEVIDQSLFVSFAPVMKSEFGNQEVELFITGLKDRNGNVIDKEIYSSITVPILDNELGSGLEGTYNGLGGIDLNWFYSGALITEGFAIERLYNTVFEEVGVQTDINARTSYVFTDEFNYRDSVYYRLKYVGREDDQVYSRIIKVTLEEEEAFTPVVSIYPNPSSDRTRIKFRLLTRDFENDIKVRVFSAQGFLVTTKSYTSEEAEQTLFELNLKNELAPGIYNIEVTQGKFISVRKLIMK